MMICHENYGWSETSCFHLKLEMYCDPMTNILRFKGVEEEIALQEERKTVVVIWLQDEYKMLFPSCELST